MQPSPQTVLVITSVEDVHADLVIEKLNERRVQVVRADPGDIGTGLMFDVCLSDDQVEWAGRLRTPSRDIALEEVGAVYYRRPTPYSGRFAHLPDVERQFAVAEAQHGLGGVLRNLRTTRYVNHPAAIWTQRVAEEKLDDSLAVTAHLFQKEVRKTADARVTVIGRTVSASRITTPADALDWRSGDWERLVHDPVDVPEQITGSLHAYLDHFGLVFGCFDFALESTGGQIPDRWTFIECNPNGQWGWLPDSDAMAHAFADLLLEGWWP